MEGKIINAKIPQYQYLLRSPKSVIPAFGVFLAILVIIGGIAMLIAIDLS